MRKNGLFEAFEPVCCDWLSGRHEYAIPIPPRESGRILRIDRDGVIEYDSQLWEQIRCSSSDTSLRVRCDGKALHFMGNIGRFGESDNVTGLTVIQCVEKWGEVLRRLGFECFGFGSRWRRRSVEGVPVVNPESSVLECGTWLTRIDLAGNFEVSDYAALSSAFMVRRIGQRLPFAGRYGPTWGYESKRSNWWKAKLYDKTAETEGKRRSAGGSTLARFEVQLGSEFLKRKGLDSVKSWMEGQNMENVVYQDFGGPLFRESLAVQSWDEIPSRLQHWATLWREGKDLRTKMSLASYYRVRAKLLEYGLDIGTPCNVLALTRHVQVVTVRPVSALRVAA